MTINWQWPSAIIFCVVTIVLGGLIFTGKLPAESIGVLVAWLIPSPIGGNKISASPLAAPSSVAVSVDTNGGAS